MAGRSTSQPASQPFLLFLKLLQDKGIANKNHFPQSSNYRKVIFVKEWNRVSAKNVNKRWNKRSVNGILWPLTDIDVYQNIILCKTSYDLVDAFGNLLATKTETKY